MNAEPEKFDLVVLGGGPAGTSGAFAAGQFGKRVALIEQVSELGGAGANTGTIPSKTLRESALLINGWKTRKLLGVDMQIRQDATVAEFTHHATNVSAAERMRLDDRARQTHVTRFTGRGRFLDPHTVAIIGADGHMTTVRGEVILIATGSTPFHPKEFPFDHPRVHDSDELLCIKHMPRVLAVVGAGVIGAEYACTFAELGVEVHLIDSRDVLLPFLDRDVSSAITRGMTGTGIHFHWNEQVTGCDPRGSQDVRLTMKSGATLDVTDVLVAAGRNSNTGDLNLSAAGLSSGERGVIAVDRHFRTCVSHIYAAGDVVGPPALAATSMEQARVAVCHAFGFLKKEFAPQLPTGIYTIPEASMVGQTEQALEEQGVDFIVGRANYAQNPRGHIIGDEEGFVKLLFRREDLRLLGVHIVGEQATELIHIGLTAMVASESCETADLFSRMCFNYPTLGDLYKYAAYDAMLKKLNRA